MKALSEVALEPGTAVIADLHLDVSPDSSAEARAERERFVAFLERLEAPRLIVLGDLFDAWVGPAHARLEPAGELLDAFAGWTARGGALEVVHGNRDFLLGADFERRTGARVHPSGLVGLASSARAGAEGGATEPDRRLLLIHGDELCTRDLAYQRLKRVLRSGPMLWAAPRIPAPVALWAARRLRKASVRAVAQKPVEAKTQQEQAVLELSARHRARTVICGHAHRFRDLRPASAEPLRWMVLGAFGGDSDLLRIGAGGHLEVDRSDRVGAGGTAPRAASESGRPGA